MMILRISESNSTMEYLDKDNNYKDILQIDTDDLWVLINKIYDYPEQLPLESQLDTGSIKNNVSKIISEKLFEKLRIFESEIEEFKADLDDIYKGDLKGLDSLEKLSDN